MKIGELESLTGIPRASIRFYEKEGLLTPVRKDNKYRDYSSEDLEMLQKIQLLRLLDVSVEDIKLLIEGQKEMLPLLENHLQELTRKQDQLASSQRVCQEICLEASSFQTLDAPKYLASYRKDSLPGENTNSNDFLSSGNANPKGTLLVSQGPKTISEAESRVYQTDRSPMVYSPVRRFFARNLDLSLYSVFWNVLLVLVFNINILNRSVPGRLLDSLVCLLLMIFLEPLFLKLWGTTLGKWILGLKVLSRSGDHLSYGEGLERTWQVMTYGLGLLVPPLSLIRLGKSLKASLNQEMLPWESNSLLELKDEKPWRGFVYVVVCGVLFGITFLTTLTSYLPKHRGDLTVAEFSENYNHFASYYGYDFGAILDETGTWQEPLDQGNVVYVGNDNYLPAYDYVLEGDHLTQLSFHYETTSDTPASCQAHMLIAILSFAFSDAPISPQLFQSIDAVLKGVQSHPFEDFHYDYDTVSIDCNVSASGYSSVSSMGWLIPQNKEHSLTMDFSITKK